MPELTVESTRQANQTPGSRNSTRPLRRRRKIWWLIAILFLFGVWVAGDWIYAQVVGRAVARWEATVERDADGVLIGARSYTLPGGHTALLLVHGFNDTPQAFQLMAPALHEQGYTVRALRLPGFGEPVEAMNRCTAEQWIDAVRSEAVTLSQQHERLVVVGHSLGAAVSLAVLAENPSLMDGIVMIAPGIDVANHRSPLLPTRVWKKLGDRFLFFSDIYQSPFDPNDCRDPRWRKPPDKPVFTSRNVVQQTFRVMDANRDRAGQIETPLLMVLSRNDQVVDWVQAEAFFERVRTPRKTLKFYDDSGHALTLDYDWENITRDIVEFVQSLDQDAAP